MKHDLADRNLNQLADEAFTIAEGVGWWPPDVLSRTRQHDPRQLGTALMLIVTEVAEAMEAVRNGDRENLAEELADVIIRTINLCAGLEIDIASAVAQKMDVNRGRAHRHGARRCE